MKALKRRRPKNNNPFYICNNYPTLSANDFKKLMDELLKEPDIDSESKKYINSRFSNLMCRIYDIERQIRILTMMEVSENE